jgi:putative acetyltransferase
VDSGIDNDFQQTTQDYVCVRRDVLIVVIAKWKLFIQRSSIGMVELRPASNDGLAALWELRTRAIAHGCAGHYGPGVLAAWLASPAPVSLQRHIEHGGGLVAVEDDAIVGYAVLDPLSGEVDAVFVDPPRHGRGIGRALLDALEANARMAGLERLFLSASLNAVPFYRASGFVALREELYAHRSGIGIPSVFMEKTLA